MRDNGQYCLVFVNKLILLQGQGMGMNEKDAIVILG